MFLIPDNVPYWQSDVKILIRDQLKIPGVHTIGYYNYRSATHRLHNHYHEMMEISVIIKGTQQYYADERPYTLQGGEIFVTKPYEPHGNNSGFQEICEYVWFQLDISDPDINFLGLSSPYSEYIFNQMKNFQKRTKTAEKSDLSMLKKAFFLLAENDERKKLLGQNYLISFIINNLCEGETEKKQTRSVSELDGAKIFINDHLYDDIDIKAVADHVGLSESRFKTRFKNEYGITPYAYITNKRIDAAKKLLRESQKSITQIAYMLNFSSSNHFSTVFKTRTGLTPSQFKKNIPIPDDENSSI